MRLLVSAFCGRYRRTFIRCYLHAAAAAAATAAATAVTSDASTAAADATSAREYVTAGAAVYQLQCSSSIHVSGDRSSGCRSAENLDVAWLQREGGRAGRPDWQAAVIRQITASSRDLAANGSVCRGVGRGRVAEQRHNAVTCLRGRYVHRIPSSLDGATVVT